MTWINRLKLRAKINLLVFLIIGVVLLLVVSSIEYSTIESRFQEAGERALMLSRTVAFLPETIRALEMETQDPNLQPFIEELRKKTGAQFIVIANMGQIRLTHPNSKEIGKHMVGEDNDAVLFGNDSITNATGTLGPSIRGKSPIRNAQGEQIGIVSVGFLMEKVWEEIWINLIGVGITGLIALLIGLFGAHLLSGSIKKQIFQMEPSEIAYLTQEQAAILESIREGIIAVNSKGIITTCNQEASKILGKDAREVKGEPIRSILPNSRLSEVLQKGGPQLDQPMIIGNTLVVANRLPVMANGQVIGAVSSFRDKQQLDQIDHRISDIGQYVDTLRSQRHEFMNKLHLLSGLITMKEYDLAKNAIEEVNHEYQSTLDFFLAHIKDPAVVGLLLGKFSKAKELNIRLHIDPGSSIPSPCPHRDIVVTFLGNTIENAFEAISSSFKKIGEAPEITSYLGIEGQRLIMRVKDNGPGIDPALGLRVLHDGVSSKGEGRGIGLTIVSRLVSNVQGTMTIKSTEEGTIVEALLPIEEVTIFEHQ
ncbi:two-component system, CitB family, sensor kinase [Paenibacillus sp. 1_12]|uniref:ATP-binding protein n=1 Tax=Paenibacillus sp. 1_12 TaxID=1566278 RepID=UPI0008E7D728|nr:sensor histidine kinase [Paenibacillus sp. 1_12]SFK73516.1 two-component system, CitB family, sensor kinase [Paenibacillus sp. 1_12]